MISDNYTIEYDTRENTRMIEAIGAFIQRFSYTAFVDNESGHIDLLYHGVVKHHFTSIKECFIFTRRMS